MSSRTAGEIWLGYRNSPDDSLDPGRRGMFFMHNQNVGSDQLDTAPYNDAAMSRVNPDELVIC